MYKILLTKEMLEDMAFFAQSQPKLLSKIVKILESVAKTPFEGIGKPEALKHDFQGYWSRRVTDEHRLIYKLENDIIVVYKCRFHY